MSSNIRNLFSRRLLPQIRLWAPRAAFDALLRAGLFLLGGLLALRVALFAALVLRAGIPASQLGTAMSGVLFDLLTTAYALAAAAAPFLVVHRFRPGLATRLASACAWILLVASALLAEYHCQTGRPLDQVALMYTPAELAGIVSSSISFTAAPYLFFAAQMALLAGVQYFTRRIQVPARPAAALTGAAIAASLSTDYRDIVAREAFYGNRADFAVAATPIAYTIIKITDSDSDATLSLDAARAGYQRLTGRPMLDPEHPFYRPADDPDVLGPMLRRTPDGSLPNLVFVIVEGLGQKLTGVDNPSVSFTPFLDSLAAQSLYWPNCLASTERTFGVLPAIFASAPFGKRGLAFASDPAPDHNSLLRDLARNGYTTSFYYGGSSSFDGQDAFMRANDVAYISDFQAVGNDTARMSRLKISHRWGLDDAETFQRALRHKAANDTAPFADIYLTLSTHEPFDLPGIEPYIKRAREMAAAAQLQPAERANIGQRPNVFACYLYADEQIRKLMDAYRRRGDYGNTLFVITGDHRMAYYAAYQNPVMKYHVPLIIHSPLAAAPRAMRSTVAHIDLAPTLTSYLANNYGYRTAPRCHWLGTSLDTAQRFAPRKRMAFMLNSREITDILFDSLALQGEQLYRVDSNLRATPVDDARRTDELISHRENLKALGYYAVNIGHLQPPPERQTAPLAQSSLFNNSAPAVTIGPDDEYTSLCPPIQPDAGQRRLLFDITTQITGLDTGRELPKLVITSSGGHYTYAPLTAANGASLNTGQREIFHLRTAIVLPRDAKGQTIRVYLWNNRKTQAYCENLDLRVVAAD